MCHAGDQDPRASPEDDSQSQLFVYRFGDSDILKHCIDTPAESPPQQKSLSSATLEENCNLYLQQRFVFGLLVLYASMI